MIHRISVTVTENGLQLNATDTKGTALQQVWLPTGLGATPVYRPDALANWRLDASMERLAQSMIPLAARLTRSLRHGRFPGMQSLTFDIGPGWVDCHVMLTTFDEVVLRYPLISEAVGGVLVLPKLPVVQGGTLDNVPDAFLNTFHQAVRTRFWPLAQQLKGKQCDTTTTAEDAA
jgi:hypothetical protein